MDDKQTNEITENQTEEEAMEVQEDKLFGMRRFRALGAMLGLAAGMILSGLMPMFGLSWLSDVGSCIFFGGAGYLIARLIDEARHLETRPKRRKKK